MMLHPNVDFNFNDVTFEFQDKVVIGPSYNLDIKRMIKFKFNIVSVFDSLKIEIRGREADTLTHTVSMSSSSPRKTINYDDVIVIDAVFTKDMKAFEPDMCGDMNVCNIYVNDINKDGF